jgi:hypothetical protein
MAAFCLERPGFLRRLPNLQRACPFGYAEISLRLLTFGVNPLHTEIAGQLTIGRPLSLPGWAGVRGLGLRSPRISATLALSSHRRLACASRNLHLQGSRAKPGAYFWVDAFRRMIHNRAMGIMRTFATEIPAMGTAPVLSAPSCLYPSLSLSLLS